MSSKIRTHSSTIFRAYRKKKYNLIFDGIPFQNLKFSDPELCPQSVPIVICRLLKKLEHCGEVLSLVTLCTHHLVELVREGAEGGGGSSHWSRTLSQPQVLGHESSAEASGVVVARRDTLHDPLISIKCTLWHQIIKILLILNTHLIDLIDVWPPL